MNESFSNIYKSARIRSGLKREPVSEELNIDVRTLDKYESVSSRPPDDIVKKMCELYGNRYLAYQHFKSSPLGSYLPDLSEETFQAATLSVINSFYNVSEIAKNITKIASGGKIDDNEREEWLKNREEITRLASSLLSLLMADTL